MLSLIFSLFAAVPRATKRAPGSMAAAISR